MRVALLILALLAFSAVPASAADTNAPPGNSGVDEYVEAIPGATGSKPAERLNTSPSAPSSLSAATRRQLAALGTDGHAVATLVAATAPKQAKKASGTTSSAKPATDVGDVAVGRAAAKVASGSGGLGLLLPVALITILAAGAGSRLIRRRA